MFVCDAIVVAWFSQTLRTCTDDKPSLLVSRVAQCWANMLKLFPEQEIRWALLNVPYKVVGGGVRERVAFVRWCPDSLQRESHKKTIQAKSNAVMFCGELAQRATKLGATLIEANSIDELELDAVLAKITKHEREPLDPSSVDNLRSIGNTEGK